MPYRDKERQLRYQREWIARRRAQYFAGKVCITCGTDDNLQLDHLDDTQKEDHRIWSWSEERRSAELAKCQVLCRDCHLAKSRAAGDFRRKGGTRNNPRTNRSDMPLLRYRSHNIPRNEKRPPGFSK